MSEADRILVTWKVRNVGTRFGKEVVQIYTGVTDSRVRRAVRELKGFEKVALMPGEEKEVQFVLEPKAFAYYEPKIQGWFLENSSAIIEIGASSRDIRLQTEIKVHSEMELPMTVTNVTSIGELMNLKKGRAFVQNFMKQIGLGDAENGTDALTEEEKERAEKNQKEDEAMGAGGERMRRQMMFEMPLNALVTYGMMKEDALVQLIDELNKK